MRAWMSVVLCLGLISAVGCGGNSKAGDVKTTLDEMSQVASTLGSIKDKVVDFEKKKDSGKDEEGRQKDLDAAIEDAKQLKATAVKWQQAVARMQSAQPLPSDEKKELLKKNQGRIDEITKSVEDAHREMKTALANADKKYHAAVRPLMQKLAEAEGEFAVVVRKK